MAFAALGAIFICVAVPLTYLVLVDREMRTFGAFVGAVGLWGGGIVAVKIVVTGRAWSFFELEVGASGVAERGSRPEPHDKDTSPNE